MKKSIFALAFGAFSIISTEFGVIGILPTLARKFSVSIETAGWLVGGFALVVALSGPFMTLLTQKINRKSILIFTLVLFSLANILAVFSSSFIVLMIARILPAFFHPVYWAIAFSVDCAADCSDFCTFAVLVSPSKLPLCAFAMPTNATKIMLNTASL